MTKTPLHGLQISAFNQKFISQNGVGIPLDEAVNFCRSLRDALRSADIVGFRSFRFDEKAMIFNHLNEGRPNAALGFLYAREFLQQGLFESWWKATVVTSAWIHLDVISHLGRIFDAAESIIFITGRAELRDEVRSRLGAKLEAFIAVPTQGYKPPLPKQSHFYSAFPAVLEQLDKDLRGKLVLVGAGLFGKIYCHAAKRNGAVAVDIGSAFDVLAGFTTRPIHRHYNVQGLRWT